MTPRELEALRRIWAEQQALFHNAHLRGPETINYIPADFMFPGERSRREMQAKRDKREVARINRELMLMKPDDENVPEWAKNMPKGVS
jgi:hypothetical protein